LGQPLAGCFAEWSKKQRRQAVKALTALSNDYQVLQGDVRPENFLLNRAGRVVVIDLESCAKELDEGIRKMALRRAVTEIKGTSTSSLGTLRLPSCLTRSLFCQVGASEAYQLCRILPHLHCRFTQYVGTNRNGMPSFKVTL
jgi:serine/threonine protein kinase